ncbi:hypothetical protein Ndes2526B_g07397 [Nannochloris sp. 'desiccata']|nr:hypothetical protein KSW81_004598 [Chlorella desiccata (nom. nud.)]KAH7618454.1 hypothetical protein NADE_000646 [Chlorella desiccata (nom. nud.)]
MFDRSLRTEIVISASASHVYDTLTDFPSYPEWNPFIKSLECEGQLQEGAKLKATMQLPGAKAGSFSPVVLKVKAPTEFRWRGSLPIPGLFIGEHFFIIKEESPNSTFLVHGEHFSGLLIPVLGGILKKAEEAFNNMNVALKQRAEGTNEAQ